MHHLEHDPLITNAFVGDRGGADPGVPPPMSRTAFLAAAKVWVDDGAACSPFDGELTQVEEFSSNYSYHPAGDPATTATVEQHAQRELTITLNEFRVTNSVLWTGVDKTTTIKTGPCVTTVVSTSGYDGRGVGDVIVRVQGNPTGAYKIEFVGPPEKSRTIDEMRISSPCGSFQPNFGPDVTTLDWNPWKFTIECPQGVNGQCVLPVPPDPQRFTGKIERTVLESKTAEQEAWFLVSPVGIGRQDSSSPQPVKITTSWDLRRIR